MQFTDAECASHDGVRIAAVSTSQPPTKLYEVPALTFIGVFQLDIVIDF